MIPQSFIDDLVNKVDIVEVIDARVPLKKAGREYTACCPFHNEKSPSFYVSPAKQFYHCFGCGAHGTAIGFLMEYERLEFPDAIRALAEQVGVEVPSEAGGDDRKRDKSLYDLMEHAAGFYRQQLKSNPRAIDYLKGRGLSGEIAADFGLGYAPDDWEGVLNYLRERGYRKEQFIATGMGIEGNKPQPFDRFRDRIMFPIRDRRGRVIAFGGRVLDQGEPKYMNSPETELFHKGRELYGLWEAKQANRDIERLLVVEGYMDVVALAQNDIRYAVATLGTATTPEHLERIFRTTKEVVFCFDGDKAGQRAAWRALENSLGSIKDGRQIRFLFLPEGEDPDTLVRQEGKEAFEARVAKADTLSEYLLNELFSRIDPSREDELTRVVDMADPLIDSVKDPIAKELLFSQLKRRLGRFGERLALSAGSLAEQLPTHRPVQMKLTPMRRAIAILLNRPDLAARADQFREDLAELDIQGIDVLLELVEFLSDRPEITMGGILEAWRDRPLGPALGKLAALDLEVPAELMQSEFEHILENQLLGSVKERRGARRLAELQVKKPSEMSEAEKAELRALLSARNT